MIGHNTRDVETAAEAIALVERHGGVHCMAVRWTDGKAR
jgi:hypothetical protein